MPNFHLHTQVLSHTETGHFTTPRISGREQAMEYPTVYVQVKSMVSRVFPWTQSISLQHSLRAESRIEEASEQALARCESQSKKCIRKCPCSEGNMMFNHQFWWYLSIFTCFFRETHLKNADDWPMLAQVFHKHAGYAGLNDAIQSSSDQADQMVEGSQILLVNAGASTSKIEI